MKRSNSFKEDLETHGTAHDLKFIGLEVDELYKNNDRARMNCQLGDETLKRLKKDYNKEDTETEDEKMFKVEKEEVFSEESEESNDSADVKEG